MAWHIGLMSNQLAKPTSIAHLALVAVCVIAVNSCGSYKHPTPPDDNTPADVATDIPGVERSYKLVDATDGYFEFWRKHRTDPLEVQIESFITEVVQANPSLYAASVVGLDSDKPYDEALRDRLKDFLPKTADKLELIVETHQRFKAQLRLYETSFLKTFHDLRYEGNIYVTAAIGGFDGATRNVGDEMALLFAVDGLAMYRPPGTDHAPFFHHELFHLYHRQVLTEAKVDSSGGRTTALALWGEGLATYVSKKLNPNASAVELLLSDELIEKTQARLSELARELMNKSNSTEPDLYAEYFLGDSLDNEGDGVPKRAGYYIGLRVAELVGKKYDLKALARLHGDKLDREIAAALASLATTPSPPNATSL